MMINHIYLKEIVMLHLNLFGGFSIRNTEDIAFSLGQKSQSLVCLLALGQGMNATREKAAGLIWSNRTDEQARASLRQELSQIRRILGSGAIASNKQSIWLVPEIVTVDACQFRTAISEAASQHHCTKYLEVAGTLYTGQILDGHNFKSDSFEEWILSERRVLDNEALGVMIQLAQYNLDQGQYDKASHWASRAIEIEPLRETSHCLLCEALALSGNRAAALAKFAQLKTLLATELGIAPTELTLSLGKKLAAGEHVIPVSRAIKINTVSSVSKKLFNGRAAVAILPFRCLSGSADDVYFADGITEDVVNGLAVWRWFPVIGRYSTNHYRDSDNAIIDVANETGARYIVDGSVRRNGSKLRVTAELCDASSGQLLWSQRFDGNAGEVFKIQDEISDEIARRVEPEISRAESSRLYRQQPSELSLWETLHKARVIKFQNGHAYGSKEDNITAMAMYRTALSRAPNSSDAVNGIATCHWHDAINSWSADPVASGASAMQCANEALALDNTNYRALATVSIIQTFGQHDTTAAEVTARKSLDMNPSDILTRHYLVCSLEFGGKFDEAVEQCKYMMELDPRAPSMSVLCGDLSTCLLLGENPVEAVEYSRKSMAADPDYSRGRQRLIAALVAAGQLTEAKHELQILQQAMPTFSLEYVKRTYPFLHKRHLNAYAKYFAEVGVK